LLFPFTARKRYRNCCTLALLGLDVPPFPTVHTSHSTMIPRPPTTRTPGIAQGQAPANPWPNPGGPPLRSATCAAFGGKVVPCDWQGLALAEQ
jgi:hypothetical protein